MIYRFTCKHTGWPITINLDNADVFIHPVADSVTVAALVGASIYTLFTGTEQECLAEEKRIALLRENNSVYSGLRFVDTLKECPA